MPMEGTTILKQGGALEEGFSQEPVQDSNLPLLYHALKCHSHPSISRFISSVMFTEKSS